MLYFTPKTSRIASFKYAGQYGFTVGMDYILWGEEKETNIPTEDSILRC